MSDELIKHLRDQAAIFRNEDQLGRGAPKLEEVADLIEQQAALVLSIQSQADQQARTIASMCQQVGDLESRADKFEVALRDIVRADPVDMALDPAWAKRIAEHALSKEYS